MELGEVWAALKVRWWAAAVGLLLGALAALLLTLVEAPLYSSSTRLFVSVTAESSTGYDVLAGSQFSQERGRSYAELLAGQQLAQRVVDDLGSDEDADSIAGRITASAVPDTVLIDVTVAGDSPQQALAIARSASEQFPLLVTELETPDGSSTSPVKVTVVDAPDLPLAASSPKVLRDVVLGALAGLLMGAVVAIGRMRLDRTVRDGAVAEALVGAPVIGVVMRDATLGERHMIDRSGDNRTAEAYRQLRTNLQFLNVDEPPRVIMVSSAIPSEGKTTAVVNLGLALADAGRKVTIVEADLRRPKVTKYLGMVGGVGLTNILAGTADLDDVIQRYGEHGLSVIAAGPTPPNPGELLASSSMNALVEKLRAQNDFVLVDAPPLLPVADSSGLAVIMDGVVLSIRYGSTRRDQVEQAAAALDRVRATKLGVILNIVPVQAELADAYGYGSTYGYAPGRSPQA